MQKEQNLTAEERRDADRKRIFFMEIYMKRISEQRVYCMAFLLVCAFFTALLRHNPQPQKAPAKAAAPVQTFVGVISDGQCAVKGSHKEVMAKRR